MKNGTRRASEEAVTRRKLPRFTRSERRMYNIQKLQSGLGMIPWGWNREEGCESELPAEAAHRVKCPSCACTYRPNQRHYIEQHFMKKHGFTFLQAFHGTLGGNAERERLGMDPWSPEEVKTVD